MAFKRRWAIFVHIAWASLLLLGLASLVLRGRPADFLVEWTGEEEFRGQLRALYSLPVSWLKPPNTKPNVPIAYAGANPYGVNVFLEQEVEEQKIRKILEMIKEAAFHWIRQQFPWREIEIPEKGRYWDEKWGKSSWEKYDRIVDLATEYGLEIIARLDAPPDWSRQDNRLYTRPPDDFADFGDFVHTIVSRYRSKIKYWQIWNEPNIYPEWGEQPVNPAEYTELLKVAYARAKEADPECVILSAGLAPTVEQGPRNLSDLIFLEKMYETGAKDYFDIMSVMAYGLWTGPSDHRAEPERANFSRPMLIRQIMVKYSDEGKAIWASEVGWNALPPDFAGEPIFGRVSEEKQASYTVRAYRRAQEEWPWMGVLNYWFFKRADAHEIEQPMYYFRMVEPDFSLLPVYYAMKELAMGEPVMYPGFHQENHWAIAYSGNWQEVEDEEASQGKYLASRSPGDSLSFTFAGSDLDLVTTGKEGSCLLEVAINGGRPMRVEFRGNSSGQRRIPLVKGLKNGKHSLSIEMETSGNSGCGIDALVVERSNLWFIRRLLGVLAVACAFGGLASLFGWSLKR